MGLDSLKGRLTIFEVIPSVFRLIRQMASVLFEPCHPDMAESLKRHATFLRRLKRTAEAELINAKSSPSPLSEKCREASARGVGIIH